MDKSVIIKEYLDKMSREEYDQFLRKLSEKLNEKLKIQNEILEKMGFDYKKYYAHEICKQLELAAWELSEQDFNVLLDEIKEFIENYAIKENHKTARANQQ